MVFDQFMDDIFQHSMLNCSPTRRHKCVDGTDQRFCGDTCGGMEDRFRCGDGQCIEAMFKCDGNKAS